MVDVVGVGANSVDFVYQLPAYPRADVPFAKLPITAYMVSCGGQVATALTTCVAMGLTASYVGTIGSDENARRMREELARVGIDAAHAVTRDAANPFAVILLDDREGERIVLWRRDTGVGLMPRDIDFDIIRSARLLHVDDVDVDASLAAAEVGRQRGIPVTSDIEKTDEGARALIDAVTVPILAEHVPSALTGETDLGRALAALRRPHHAMLCVTRGARGAILLAEGRLHAEAGIAVKTVDTTGSGDVFRGAFIYALLKGSVPEEILRFSNAAAAVSCMRLGAMNSVPTVAEVADFTAKCARTTKDTNPFS